MAQVSMADTKGDRNKTRTRMKREREREREREVWIDAI